MRHMCCDNIIVAVHVSNRRDCKGTKQVFRKALNNAGFVPTVVISDGLHGYKRAVWKKMYHYFLYKYDEFLEHYHKRSNAETCFHMIKTKFRDNLRSKTQTAKINELLLKILCHNICVVIQEILELRIKGEFIVEKQHS